MSAKYKIPFINACIRAFAKRHNLSTTAAFNYLRVYGGVEFLDNYYEAVHLESIDDAVDDLILLSKKNEGNWDETLSWHQ